MHLESNKSLPLCQVNKYNHSLNKYNVSSITVRQYIKNNVSYAASSMAAMQTHKNRRRASASLATAHFVCASRFQKILWIY